MRLLWVAFLISFCGSVPTPHPGSSTSPPSADEENCCLRSLKAFGTPFIIDRLNIFYGMNWNRAPDDAYIQILNFTFTFSPRLMNGTDTVCKLPIGDAVDLKEWEVDPDTAFLYYACASLKPKEKPVESEGFEPWLIVLICCLIIGYSLGTIVYCWIRSRSASANFRNVAMNSMEYPADPQTPPPSPVYVGLAPIPEEVFESTTDLAASPTLSTTNSVTPIAMSTFKQMPIGNAVSDCSMPSSRSVPLGMEPLIFQALPLVLKERILKKAPYRSAAWKKMAKPPHDCVTIAIYPCENEENVFMVFVTIKGELIGHTEQNPWPLDPSEIWKVLEEYRLSDIHILSWSSPINADNVRRELAGYGTKFYDDFKFTCRFSSINYH